MAEKTSKKLTFLDLGVDCLLNFCDGLDFETLCSIADTCHTMRDIAHKSFELRKIQACHYYETIPEHPLPSNVLIIADGMLVMARVLRLFGDLLLQIRMPASDRHHILFDNMVAHCSGTLRSLHLESDRDFWKPLDVDLRPLFRGLNELRLLNSSFGVLQYPFGVCEQLTTLSIFHCRYDVLWPVWNTKFPKLKRCAIDTDVKLHHSGIDTFIDNHPQLTGLSIKSSKFAFTSFSKLQNLEELTLDHCTVEMRRLIGAMPLKSLTLGGFQRMKMFVKFLSSSSVLIEHLEELTAVVMGLHDTGEENNKVWTALARCKELRRLNLNFLSAFDPQQLLAGMEILIAEMAVIEWAFLGCWPCDAATAMPDFQRTLTRGQLLVRNNATNHGQGVHMCFEKHEQP